MVRGETFRLPPPRGARGHERYGARYAVVVQADELLDLSTTLVVPTSVSARPASFRPPIAVSGTETRVLVDRIDGEPIGKVNFVLRDSKDRLWITVSTRIVNWMKAISPNIRDGFIALYDKGALRIVADNIAFTNEVRLDANEEWLYVVETCGPFVSRFRIAADGSLSGREIYGPSDHGAFIDGIAFDAHGNLWGTHVMTDRIFAITPEGDLRVILDDDNPKPSRALMDAFRRDAVTPEHMLACGGTIAPWFASVTFGGKDLRNVYIGSLRGTQLPYFRSPVAGLPMAHWL